MFINGIGATKHIEIPRNILPHNANLKAEFCLSFKGIFTSIWSTSLNIRKMIFFIEFFVNLFMIKEKNLITIFHTHLCNHNVTKNCHETKQ